jgi:hypothetical protein
VQAHPIKPKLKPPGAKRFKLDHDEPLSNFAFGFNLRRYIWVRRAVQARDGRILRYAHQRRAMAAAAARWAGAYTRQLFSSTYAALVAPLRVPLSNRLGENHAPNITNKMCLR